MPAVSDCEKLGHKVQSGLSSASHNRSRGWAQTLPPRATVSHFPCDSDSIYINMYIRAVRRHFSGFQARVARMKPDELHAKLKTTSVTTPASAPLPLFFCFLLFITKLFCWGFHFRCVLSSWSLWDSYPDEYHCCCCCCRSARFCLQDRQEGGNCKLTCKPELQSQKASREKSDI